MNRGERRDRRTGEASERGSGTVFSPLGASQYYSTNRSDREFYLSPRPICAVGLKFSLRKVFWIISAAILIQLLHHRVGANGGGSLSGVPSPSSHTWNGFIQSTPAVIGTFQETARVNYPNDKNYANSLWPVPSVCFLLLLVLIHF